jgi:hypothetical protein
MPIVPTLIEIHTHEFGGYVATCLRGEFLGASPDEALGYAIRNITLYGGIERDDDFVIVPNIAVKFLSS